jgi:hypothetical protein
MTDPDQGHPPSLPTNRKEALTLLRKVDFDLAQLSPEAIAAIRAAFHLPREGGP